MRKLTVLWLAGVFILALGATGYAQPVMPTPAAQYPPPGPKVDFRASGMMDAQSFLDENVPPRNTSAGIYQVVSPTLNTFTKTNQPANALNRNVSFWDSRAHLKFDAVLGKELSGTMMFEIDTQRWGAPFGGYPGLGREANMFGAWTTDRTAVEVKNIYFDVGIPYFGIPVPMTVRLGAQPLSIRPNVFVYSDGMGIWPTLKLDPVTIQPLWFKALQGDDFKSNGVNVYGLHTQANIATVSVGGYGLFYNMDAYPFQVTQTVAGLPSALNPTVVGTQQAKIWWWGLYADGKAGPVDFNFDFVYDYGRAQSSGKNDVPNVKYRGWVSRLKIDYPWDKFNFGVVGMYASGADAEKTSATGLPGSLTNTGALTTRVGSFVVPVGSEQDTNNNESIVMYGTDAGASGGIGIAKTANYTQVSRGGFGGTWFAKFYGSFKATPVYKVTVQGLYIGDTTQHGNTLGNAVIPGTTTLRNDSSIGFELDLINELQIYTNLKLTVGGGYLWAGNALDLRQGTLKNNFSPDNPWAFRTRLMYLF